MSKTQRIKPQTLRGFRDFLPDQMMARERLIDTARRVYRSYGFAPIDTPALEYAEILLGKGGEESDKQVFRFTDQGDRDVAMRFDLTVPLARFAAMHASDLGTPFRRYHIGPVWRGERPARGRFREFLQCDFDTIGTTSINSDIETLLVIHDLLEAIGIERFTVRVNNRRILNGLLEKSGLADSAVAVLRALDKLDKIGADGVVQEMTDRAGLQATDAERIVGMAEIQGDADAVLQQLAPLVSGTETGERGLAELSELFAAVRRCGLSADRVRPDVAIARGLDYYTGTIYETVLGDLPEIGSVCSGGRYDDLTGLFTAQPLPGVGASLGLDRMLAALEELGQVDTASTPADVLVTMFDKDRAADYLALGRDLRAAGIAAEVYPEAKGLGKQMKYANRRGFRCAVIIGPDEFAANECKLKDLDTGDELSVMQSELAGQIHRILRPGEDVSA